MFPDKSCYPHSLTNFLVIYFNFTYSLCLSPFRIKRTENGFYKAEKNIVQTIICAVLSCLAIVYLIAFVRIIYVNTLLQDHTSPVKYFRLLTTIFTFFFQILTIKKFWFSRHSFLNIVNFIQSESDVLPNKPMKVQSKLFISTICVTFSATAFYAFLYDRILADSTTWDKTVWDRRLISKTRFAFFMINHTESRKIPELEDLLSVDYFHAVLAGLAYYQITLMDFYPDLGLLFMVLTVRIACSQFAKILQADIDLSMNKFSQNKSSILPITQKGRKVYWPEIYSLYKNLRQLCELANHAFGSMVTVYLAVNLCHQSFKIDEIFIASDLKSQIAQVIYVATYSAVLLLSADVCDKLGTLKTWLSKDENRRGIPLDQLNVILGELGSREIGIRGSNTFTITYPLLWNVLATVVTYFIICTKVCKQRRKS